MKQFIFLTDEGSTFQPGSNALEPDIDNLQVVGFSQGLNAREAFEIMLSASPYLKDTSFDRVFALRLSADVKEMYSNQFSIRTNQSN